MRNPIFSPLPVQTEGGLQVLLMSRSKNVELRVSVINTLDFKCAWERMEASVGCVLGTNKDPV